jgi:virulence-associated protein VagC
MTCTYVDIFKIGRSRVIVPRGNRWDDLFLSGSRASEDFMVEQQVAEKARCCPAKEYVDEVHGLDSTVFATNAVE